MILPLSIIRFVFAHNRLLSYITLTDELVARNFAILAHHCHLRNHIHGHHTKFLEYIGRCHISIPHRSIFLNRKISLITTIFAILVAIAIFKLVYATFQRTFYRVLIGERGKSGKHELETRNWKLFSLKAQLKLEK